MGCGLEFNDVPTSLPGETDDSAEALPGLHYVQDGQGTVAGVQPRTQLSLDFIMVENYDPSPDGHLKHDRTLRTGLRFEAVVNCPGSYMLEERRAASLCGTARGLAARKPWASVARRRSFDVRHRRFRNLAGRRRSLRVRKPRRASRSAAAHTRTHTHTHTPDAPEEHIKRHKPPHLLQTIMWASLVTGGTPNQLVFVAGFPEEAGRSGMRWPSGGCERGLHEKSRLVMSFLMYLSRMQIC